MTIKIVRARQFVRYGRKQDMPLLAKGELGYADDQADDLLHIGTGEENISLKEKLLAPVMSDLANILKFDVKKYGAIGGGIVDDTAAIQSAIDAAHADGGGTVYFPKGLYRVASTITMHSNVHILGQNRWNSVVKLDDASTVALFDCSGTAETPKVNMGFDNINLRHKIGLAGSPTTDGKGVLIYAKYTALCQVNRCVFSDYTFAAIYLERTVNGGNYSMSWQIHDCIFNGNIVQKSISSACHYGVWCGTSAEYVDISGNQAFFMQSAVYMKNTANEHIVNNIIVSCNDGIKHESDAYASNGKLLISGNTINHCYNSGIYIQVQNSNNPGIQSGCTITSNKILLPIVQGIRLLGGIGHLCTSNKIITSNAGDKGIVLADNGASHKASYCLVAHNVVQSNVSGQTGVIDSTGATGAGNVVEPNILVVTP